VEVKVEVIEEALRQGRAILSEHESKEVLKAYGIPVTREVEVIDPEGLREAVERIGFPLVIKACGPELSHKTESGLVRVDIRDMDEALSAYHQLHGAMAGQSGGTILVQEMIKGQRELVVGLTRDPQFGPCVMFGLGGIFTEVLRDISFRVAPIEHRDAMEMMQEIRARKILEGVRGMPPADLDKLAQILIRVGSIGVEQEAIKEIDINPVILKGSEPVAVDALVVLNQ